MQPLDSSDVSLRLESRAYSRPCIIGPGPVRPTAQASTRVAGCWGSKQPSWQQGRRRQRHKLLLSVSLRTFLSPMTDVCLFRPPWPAGWPRPIRPNRRPPPPWRSPSAKFFGLRRLASVCRGQPHVAHGSVRYRAAGQEQSWPPYQTSQWKAQGGLGVLQLKNSFPLRFLSVFGLVSGTVRYPPSGARPMIQSNGGTGRTIAALDRWAGPTTSEHLGLSSAAGQQPPGHSSARLATRRSYLVFAVLGSRLWIAVALWARAVIPREPTSWGTAACGQEPLACFQETRRPGSQLMMGGPTTTLQVRGQARCLPAGD